MSTKIYLGDELIGETGDLEIAGPNCHALNDGGGYRRSAEILTLRGAGHMRIYMPLQFLDSAGFEPRKPWVRDKDWEQRAPRRRRRR